MPDTGAREITDLLAALRDAGFEVINVGARYRVTNPAGGSPAFVPLRLPRNARINGIMKGLLNIGFDETQVERQHEKDRQRKLAIDRAANAAALKRASAKAAARTAAEKEAERLAVAKEQAEQLMPGRPTFELEEIFPSGGAEPRTDWIDVTPEFALELLKANKFFTDRPEGETVLSNRRFVPELVERYKKAILRGEWTLTHQGIGLDINGDLIDGQHRLAAIVQAGEERADPPVVVRMPITYDLPPEAITHVDGGRKRTLSDLLSMEGEQNTTLTAAAVGLLLAYDSGEPFTSWRQRTTTYDQAQAVLTREPTLRHSVRRGDLLSKERSLAVLPTAAVVGYHLVSRAYGADKAEEFLQPVRTGAGLEHGDPRLVLRNHFLRLAGAGKRQRRFPINQLAVVIKAFNAWVAGRSIQMIYWRNSEEFPRLLTP